MQVIDQIVEISRIELERVSLPCFSKFRVEVALALQIEGDRLVEAIEMEVLGPSEIPKLMHAYSNEYGLTGTVMLQIGSS